MINMRAKDAERAAQVFLNKKQGAELIDNDMFFDAEGFHTSNKEIANILSVGANDNSGTGASSNINEGGSGGAKTTV